MSYLYGILPVIIGTSLFAMDKDSNSNNSKQSESYHMESKLSKISSHEGTKTVTYKYPDGSKSSYTKYSDKE